MKNFDDDINKYKLSKSLGNSQGKITKNSNFGMSFIPSNFSRRPNTKNQSLISTENVKNETVNKQNNSSKPGNNIKFSIPGSEFKGNKKK